MRRRLLQCALLPTLIASGAMADPEGWTRIGPEGGRLTAVAYDPVRPELTYAIAQYQLFRRSGAGSWTRVLPDESAYGLAVAPGGRVYVGGFGRVLRSRDHGATFTAVALPANTGIGRLAVDPTDPDVAYAVNTVHPWFLDGVEQQTLWRSADGGASWQALRTLPAERIAGVAVGPDVPTTLYVGAERAGILVSSDGGATWTNPESSPCPGLDQNGEPRRCVEAILARSGALLIGTYDAGVLRSADGGATWQAVSDPAYVDDLSVAAGAADVLYAAGATAWPGLGRDAGVRGLVLRSEDGGASWQATDDAPTAPVAAVAADPRDPDHLLAATGSVDGFAGHGLYASRDAGASWRLDQRGLDATCAHAIAAAATATTTLHISAPVDTASLYRSQDRGQTWMAPALDPQQVTAYALAVDPNDPLRVYAAVLGDGLLVSADGGASWERRDLGGLEALDVAVDPFAPETVYIALNDARLAVSRDGGATLEFASLPGGTDFGFMQIEVDDAAGAVYALSYGALLASRDQGATWEFALYAAGNDYFSALAVAPTTPATVYVAGSDGLRVSEDGGRTWRFAPVPLAPPDTVQVLAVDTSNARVAYGIAYGQSGPQMFRTDDSGRSWRSLGRSPFASALAVDPNDGHIVYAATCGAGVQRLVQPGAGGGADHDGCTVVPPARSGGALVAHALVVMLLLWLRRSAM